MSELICDIMEGPLLSAYIEYESDYAHFIEAKKTLKEEGYRIITLEENAKLRMQEGNDARVSYYGNLTAADFIYNYKKGFYLTLASIITKEKEGEIFYLSREQLKRALSRSIFLGKAREEEIWIPTRKFGEEKITNFAFGKIAKKYGLFLREKKNLAYVTITLPYVNEQLNEPEHFAEKVWFDESTFGGQKWYEVGRLRGVRENPEYNKLETKLEKGKRK